MKRHMTNEKNKTDADWEMSKKQKSDSASNILQEQAPSDHYTNEAAERKETSLDEENLETDGEKALFTKGQCQKSDDGRRQILKPGFGFDQKTKIFRRDCNEKSSTNQSVKTRSVGVNLKQGVEGTRVAEQNQTTKDLPGKESATNMKKLEPNQDETNKTNKKPIAKIANNSNTNPEIPEPHQDKTNKTHTKPVAKIANNPTTKPETLEMDVIYTRKLQEWTLPKAPKQVLSSYEDMSPKKLPCEYGAKFCGIPLNRKKPDQKTNILIPHKYADKPEGDDFGAILYTYKEHMEYGGIYYRHFFGNVIPGQPASEMKIEEYDELVLLNDVFVPKLKHTDVLNLFHHDVKVDGKTRFSLVIRRKTEEKWKWIETSAILAPEKQTDTPAVTKRRYNEEPGDKVIYLPASKHLYKAHGSNKYIDVCDGEVRMDTMKTGDNRTKILWKRPKFWQVGTEGHVDFATTLSDITKKWYIEMNNKKIVVDREPFWFKMINVGSTIRFQYQNLYLGYNLDNDELQAQVSNCTFEEFPASSVDKADDVSSKHEAEADLDNSGKISGAQPLHLNITSPETYRYPDKNSDFSSPTLSSADSGASGFGFTRSCSSVSDNSDHLSVTSESSGYRTSTPEDMDINSPQETCPKFPTRGFPWSSHLAPVDTPTTPMKNMALSEVD